MPSKTKEEKDTNVPNEDQRPENVTAIDAAKLIAEAIEKLTPRPRVLSAEATAVIATWNNLMRQQKKMHKVASDNFSKRIVNSFQATPALPGTTPVSRS